MVEPKLLRSALRAALPLSRPRNLGGSAPRPAKESVRWSGQACRGAPDPETPGKPSNCTGARSEFLIAPIETHRARTLYLKCKSSLWPASSFFLV